MVSFFAFAVVVNGMLQTTLIMLFTLQFYSSWVIISLHHLPLKKRSSTILPDPKIFYTSAASNKYHDCQHIL